MSDDIDIRIDGCAGRITLNRPEALNALSYPMCMAIDAALDEWRDDDQVKLLVIDAADDKAFCAGGDIADLYDAGQRQDYAYAQKFWRDEYRMNAKMFEFPKPVVSLMQGFTMGGGVGVSCHGSHRIVCENSQIAMPECGIGLVPDVGGSLILAQAPGRLGEYLGTTATRMGPADAIFAGFADYYIPRDAWAGLIETLCQTGDYTAVDTTSIEPPQGVLSVQMDQINNHFAGTDLRSVLNSLEYGEQTDFTASALKSLSRVSPLSAGCTIEMIHRLRGKPTIREALKQEYRFTYRALEYSDIIEGIRAAIIDKDRSPKWQHDAPPNTMDVAKMLMPLGADELIF